MSALTLVSRATGFLRIVVVTGVLGTTYLANTYQTANTVPNLLFELLAAGLLSAVLVPMLVRLHDARDDRELRHVTGAVYGLVGVGLAVVAAVGIALGPWIMGLMVRDVPDASVRAAEQRLGVFLLWFFLPQVVLYGANTIATGVLNSQGRFVLVAFAPTLNNVVVITTYLVFDAMRGASAPSLDLTTAEKLVLAGGTTLGVVVFCAVPVLAAHRLVPIRPNLDHRHPEVRRLARDGVWAGVFVAMTQLLLGVMLQLANRREGAVVVFQFAWTLFLLPHALLSVPVLTTWFPTLSRGATDGDWDGFGDGVARGSRSILFLTLPAAALLAALREPVAHLVVHGRASGRLGEIAEATGSFAVGVTGFGLLMFFTRGWYALRRARVPAAANSVGAAVGILVAVVGVGAVSGPHLVTALGLAFAAAATLGAVILGVLLVREVRRNGGAVHGLAPAVGTNLAAAACAGTVVAVGVGVSSATSIAGSMAEIAVGAAVGGLVFLVVQSMLGGPPPIEAVRTLGSPATPPGGDGRRGATGS